MKVVAIIQARMGSTRLPGKSMMSFLGKPVIQYVIKRVSSAKLVNDVWLATTINAEDDVLELWAKKNNVNYFRGSSNDVLDRYYETARLAKADVVVRITGDCPMIDPEVVDKVAREYLEGRFDYVCNTQPPTYPDGLDTEVFSFASLERAWYESNLKSEREHVTPYIWKQQDKFKIKNIENEVDLSALRLTLDAKNDFEFIKKIIEELNGKVFFLKEILDCLEKHPKWLTINSQYERNEGYDRSLSQD